MTLRARLLLVLIGLVAAGLIISDAVTYTELRSFLLTRLDPQLEGASYTMGRALESAAGIGPSLPFAVVPPPGSATTTPPAGASRRPVGLPRRLGREGALEPAGTVGELVGPGGGVVGRPISIIYSGKAPAPPTLPHPLPSVGSQGYAIFNASGSGPGAVAYRVIERPLHFRNLTVIVGIPLSDVNDTLNRLLLVEVLVSGAVLAALAVLARWIVRRGLRPLDDMAEAAGEIAGGQLGRRVTPADDHTEVGRLGRALNSMLGEIEEAFSVRAASEERLRRFLADASHELRTPLTSIRGYAELFDLGAKERPADLATSMRHIRHEADRMTVLVDDLLLLARLDRQRPLDLTPADLVPVIRRATEAAQVNAVGHRLRLSVPDRLVIPCDADRVRQVLDNLLANAVRHSPPGAPVEVTLVPAQTHVTLLVRDHGPGVSEEESSRIFEPFHRADFARARDEGGAGLGLAIVAAIARAHGGAVGVRRPDGGGAEFWVILPAGGAEGPESPDSVPSARNEPERLGPPALGGEPSPDLPLHEVSH
jgi:two-component system, OmpR family, sensor kinase